MAKSRARKAALRRRKGAAPIGAAGSPDGAPTGATGLLDATADHGAQRFVPIGGGRLTRRPDNALVRLEGADAQNFGRTRARIVTQSVVDAYFAARTLTKRQWRAANLILSAFHRARFDSIKSANLLGAGGGRSTLDNMSAKTLEARDEYIKRMEAIGMVGEKAIYWIVISNYSARDFAHKEHLNRDDGMGVLRLALNALADAYGLPPDREACAGTA